MITKVGDTDVTNAADLIGAIRSHDPGDDVTVTYTRDGSSAQVTVHLGDRSDIDPQLAAFLGHAHAPSRTGRNGPGCGTA